MGSVVMRIGMVGVSEGNGHPFSFSAIINGYSEEGLAASGWAVIYNYVRRRSPSEFGFDGVRVTHAWTQDPAVTRQLRSACHIPNEALTPESMIGSVDAVIIARDDYENHLAMALPFLQAGLHVFVDKPLSLNVEELRVFRPYLERGKLMSCSGMRYARELDEPRASLADYGEIRLIRGAILNSWEKYGVHLVDAILNTVSSKPVAVAALPAGHASFVVSMSDESIVQFDALGDVGPCFQIDIFGTRRITSHAISDNFSMFRRLLWHFIQSVKDGKPAIDPLHTLGTMKLLIAARMARSQERRVELDEIQL
jgi:hypothetical protein